MQEGTVVVTRVAVFGKRMPGKRPLRSPTAACTAAPCASPSLCFSSPRQSDRYVPRRRFVASASIDLPVMLTFCWPTARCTITMTRGFIVRRGSEPT